MNAFYEPCGRCWVCSVLLFAWTRENTKCIYFGRNAALLSTKSTMCCWCIEWDTHSVFGVLRRRYCVRLWGWVNSIMTFQVESPSTAKRADKQIENSSKCFWYGKATVLPGIAVNSWNLEVYCHNPLQLSELLQMKWRYFNLLKRSPSLLLIKFWMGTPWVNSFTKINKNYLIRDKNLRFASNPECEH